MKKIGRKFLQIFMAFCMIFSSFQTPIQVLADTLTTVTPQKGDLRVGTEITQEDSVSVTAGASSLTNFGDVQIVKTVSKTEVEGKYNISFLIKGQGKTTTTDKPTYTVFVLDASKSMDCTGPSSGSGCEDTSNGTPWDNAKKAAISFSEDVVAEGEEHKIALVTFNSNGYQKRGFANTAFTNSDFGSTSQGTKYNTGLTQAYNYFNALSEEEKTNSNLSIIFISDGEPSDSNYSTTLSNLEKLGVNIYTFAYNLDETEDRNAYNVLKSISTDNNVTSVTSSNISDILKLFIESVTDKTPAGGNATLTDNIGSNFKIVDNSITSYGGTYVSETITELTEDGTVISFDIQIDPDSKTGWHNTNANFNLVYTDANGEEQTIECTENPEVYWVQNEYDYVVNYYKDTFENEAFKSDTRQAVKGTVIDATNADINKYLTEAGVGYEYNTINPASITITNNGTHSELNILYTLKKYNYSVNYYYDNVLDTETSQRINATITEVEHGTEIDPTTYYLENIEGETVKDGYKLDSKTSQAIVVIDSENEIINIYYTKDSFNYSVNYHFNGNKDTDLSTSSNLALYNEVIKSEDKHLTQDVLDSNDYSDYFLDETQEESNYKDITITSDPSKNIINIYYVNTFVTNEDIEKTANLNKITSANDVVTYEINYTSTINNLQSGKVVTVTLTDTLPYEIETNKSSYIIDGEEIGFDENSENTNKCTVSGTTLTCVVSRTNSTYTKTYNVDETVKLNLVYKDFVKNLSPTNNTLTNTVKGTTTVVNKTTTGVTDEADITAEIESKVTAIYVDVSDKELATSESTTGLIGETYETEEKTIYGYTLKETPANATGTYAEDEIIVKYVYTKNAGELKTEENSKIQNNEIKDINSEFNYTLTYSGTIEDFVGTATVTITDTFPFEVETISYDEESCTFENNTLTCTKEVEISETSKEVNASFDVTVTYKNLTSKEDLTIINIATTEVKFDKTTETIETNETKDEIKSSKVTAIYVDESNKELASSESTTGLIGETYETEEKTIYGYTLKETPENKTGTYTTDEITVKYVYTKNVGELSNEQVNKSQNNIISSIDSIFKYTLTYSAIIDKYVGEATITLTDELPYEVDTITYDEESCTFENNTITCTKTESISESDKVISASFDIVVKYKDLSSKEDLAINNEVNSMLTYGNISTPNNADVTNTISSSKVTAIYVDETDKELATSESTTGLIGESYETEEKTIYGYTLKETPENKTGKYTADEITVKYVYTKNAGELKTEENSKVQNNEIKDINSEFNYTLTYAGTIEDFVGTATVTITDIFPLEVETITYDEESCTFENNTLTCTKEVEITETSKEVNASFDVTVTYKNLTSKEDLTIANIATTEVKFDKTTETIETNETKDEIKSSKVTAIYVDEQDKELASSESTTGLIGESYETEEKTIYGYTLKETPENKTGKYTADEITVKYVYTKNAGELKTEENSKVQNNEIKDINSEFNYTLTYAGTIEDFVGTATVTITDIFPLEVDTITYDEESCTFENNTLTCTKEVTISETSKEVNASFDVTVTYKDLTSTEDLTIVNIATTEVKFDKTTETDDTNETKDEIKSSKVTAIYVDESNKELASSESTTGLIGEIYETEEKTIYGYTLKSVPENKTGTYITDEITVKYVYTKNVGSSSEELDKTGPEKVDSINSAFDYTIKYNTEVFNYIGDVSIKIIDTPSYEIDLEKTILPTSCKYENGLIVCDYLKTIKSETESKIVIIENFVLYYKNITSSQVTNKAEASTTYGNVDKYSDDQVVTEVSKGKLIVNYVTEDGTILAPAEITENLVGTSYETKSKAFNKYYLKEVLGKETGKYQQEDTEITYVYSLIPLPPQTGVEANAKTDYISFFLSVITLFILRRKFAK